MQAKRLDPAIPYFLHPDAQFLRPGELLGRKHASEIGQENYVLSCPTMRARSKVVSARIRSLLQRFRAGARVAEVIMAFAREHGEDPKFLLRTYLPVLQDLRRWNYLCELYELHQHEEVSKGVPLDLPGYLSGRTLKRTAECMVAEAFSEDGAHVCVKQVAAGASTLEREKVVNEAKILQILDGLNVPSVLAFMPESPECSLVTSWVGQFSAKDAFSGVLGVGIVVNTDLALNIAVAILRTFHGIHARGILHSDIHHNNLRFDESRRWSVIDFGLAFAEGSTEASTPLLEAVAQYLAPEQLPSLEGDHYRRPDRRSEQYSLAALFFYLLAGVHYLDFCLETTAVISQIKTEKARQLVLRNGEVIGALDATFQRALSKSPADRFASVNDFADAIESAHRASRPPPQPGTMGRMTGGNHQSSSCTDLLTPDRAIRCQGEIFGVTGCLNLGLTALAFAAIHHDPSYLDGALIWASHARRIKGTSTLFEQEIQSSARQDVPLFIGTACLHDLPLAADLALLAIDHAVTGTNILPAGLPDALCREAEQAQRWDFTGGHACLLNALSHFTGVGCTEKIFQTVGDKLSEGLSQRLTRFAAGDKSVLPGFGFAHGRAGVLYALLRWSQANGMDAHKLLRASVRDFFEEVATDDDGSRPRTFRPMYAPPSLSWWCNGLSGIVGLLELAERAAPGCADAVTLASIAMMQASACTPSVKHICCGDAGVALALWQCARMTGDAAWHRKAWDALAKAGTSAGGEMSLLKGDLGVVLVMEVMRSECMVSVPLFLEM